MVWPFDSQHKSNVQFKRKQRSERINALKDYHQSLTSREQSVLKQNVQDVVKQLKAGELTSREVLKAYGKKALLVHAQTNALTEIMIKEAETWANETSLETPLAGFPVSLKDPFIVAGFDALAGFSAYTNQPFKEDGAVVKVVRAAGGLPYVKTNVPATMMSIEGYNDVWGRTVNPHNPKYAPGGSSQGEGALIGGGGSRIGIGTDIGGSVRVPAAWSGIYSLKFSTFRFPFDGDVSCDQGNEGVQYVASPMAKTVEDLRYFVEAIFSVNPSKYDYHLIPLPWRKDVKLPAKPRVGVLDLEDLLPLTPAQRRALTVTADALKKQGCELVPFKPPSPSREYAYTVFDLYEASGYEGLTKPLSRGEHNDPYVEGVLRYVRVPELVLKVWRFVLRLVGFGGYARTCPRKRALTVYDYEKAVAKRQSLRREFRNAWDRENLDFMISAPHPSPAVPNFVPKSFYAVLYTSIFNLLDYPAGIVPVGKVDSALDRVPPAFDSSKLSYEGKISFETYDSKSMEGLPIAVQVVGLRYKDEETLAAMEYVVKALREAGIVYSSD